MRNNRVTVLVSSEDAFIINVPLDNGGREMRIFRQKFLELVEGSETAVETTKVRRRNGIYFFQILTELGKERLEILANQALKSVLSYERR